MKRRLFIYIKILKIFETYPTNKVIHDINFQVGINYTVDARDGGNEVGKITTLRLIEPLENHLNNN